MADSEAVQLLTKAQDGNPEAQIQLVASHRRIVARVAEQYARLVFPPRSGFNLESMALE